MRSAFRLIVWGPGIVGSALIREILQKPELELVGVLAYSPHKNGQDVGESLGMTKVGVRMTTDQEAIIAMPADCVLYCPRVSASCEIDSEATNTLCRLLESGKNVITSIGYWHPAHQGQGYVDKLENACRKGGTSLHSTGVNPGWLNERLVVALTGACTSITSIKVQEFSDNSDIDSIDMMRAIGYGLPQGSKPWIENVGDRGYGETVALTCQLLGVKIDRIVSEKQYMIAKRDYQLKALVVPEGTIAGLIYKYIAMVGDRPFMTLEEIWYVDPETCPEPIDGRDYYTIVIEGKPTSVKARFELQASIVDDLRFRPGDHTLPAYYATAVPMIQAIPIVCGARPGIVYPHTFAHFVPDLRDFKSSLIAN
jgi:hypothetical protein